MRTYSVSTDTTAHACNCIGPQNGQPYCPCTMAARKVFEHNGRWVEPARGERDLGPAYPVEYFDISNA